MKLITLASKIKEDGALEEIFRNEIGKKFYDEMVAHSETPEDNMLKLKLNFYNRYDGIAQKLKDQLITDKWNTIKKAAEEKQDEQKKLNKAKEAQGSTNKKGTKPKGKYKKESKREKNKELNTSLHSIQSKGMVHFQVF